MYASVCSLQLVGWIPYLSKTLSFIYNINVLRAAQQVELVSASQGCVVSDCKVIPSQKIYIYISAVIFYSVHQEHTWDPCISLLIH